MEPEIIYQDEHLLVLNKPAGWVVNDAETTKNSPTIQKWLKDNFQFPIFDDPKCRNGIVHRLDKDTSGILLVAKTFDVFTDLQSQFKNRIVAKTYVALAHGKIEAKEGEIKATVGRLPWRRDRFGVLPGGREAVTNYKVNTYFSLDKNIYTLLSLFPKTGRTHQIRIHLKYLGHPIVSDGFYAGRKTSRKDKIWCARLFLHAEGIQFRDPKSEKVMSFKAELPADLKLALGKLSRIEET
jgi:23S rRNA pseudouridine1911/1915/1917 synthase